MSNGIKDVLREEIAKALEALHIAVPAEEILLDHPADLKFGDYSTNVAMVLAKKTGKNPHELATDITAQLAQQKNPLIEKTEAAGGFINFYLTPDFYIEELKTILTVGDNFGAGKKKDQKVLVEYSSPNIAKPFTIGHLRSTIIGDAIANILSFCGYEVIRDNHLGDWGTQFGKQIVAIKKWGNEAEIEKSINPVKELVALYVKFHEEAEKDPALEDLAREEFLKLEKGDAEAKKIWQKCIDWSLAEFNKIYGELGVRFGTMLGESTFVSKSEEVYQALEEKKLMRQSDGADVVFFEGDKLPPLIVRKKDGSSIYATRDLGADLYRQQTYGEGVKIINEAGSEQKLYFEQLYEIEKMLGWFKEGERIHVSHGLYRFADGKMSTRKGNVIWLEDVLSEAVKRAGDFNPAVAAETGIGALKYNDLKRESSANITFEWNDVLNLKGNSGPYLQYTYARTQSVLEKAKAENVPAFADSFGVAKDEVTSLEKMLYRFPEVVERTAGEYAPHHICTYLYELAGAFNNYYADHQIVSKEATAPYRVALATAVGQVLKNGLNLLGIKAPAKM